MRLFKNRTFSAANGASLLMFFGMFGSIFLLSQYLQNVQGYSPLAAGVRTLPWTGMPMIVAPIAGALTDRFGGKPFLVAGLALQAIALAWMAAVLSPNVPYTQIVAPFALAGVGMGLFFAPVATMIMSSVRLIEAGQASGANNAIRELGGVFGVAVLASIFAHKGGYGSASLFTDGILPALWVGSGVVAAGFVAALLLPGRAAHGGRAGQPRPSSSRSRPDRAAEGAGVLRGAGPASFQVTGWTCVVSPPPAAMCSANAGGSSTTAISPLPVRSSWIARSVLGQVNTWASAEAPEHRPVDMAGNDARDVGRLLEQAASSARLASSRPISSITRIPVTSGGWCIASTVGVSRSA